MKLTRNNIGEKCSRNLGHWQAIQIGWPRAEENFIPAIELRDRHSQTAAQIPLTGVQFTWLAALPASGTATAQTRAFVFTTEAKRDKF